ncbi:hypothetical protein JCM10908_003897 [Rhodotorula pacifica]|uniref:uncharacterized protein n=1 Tax=Rhodotorula pacifica TaxID=1495444 RepID=UPI003171720E
MWSKVAKLASPAPRKPATRLDAPTPEHLFTSLRRVLEHDEVAGADSTTRSAGQAAEVQQLLDLLLHVLQAEARSDSPLGETLEFILENNSLGTLVDLALGREDQAIRTALLRWYAEAVDSLDGAWLSHSAVNKPLTKLIKVSLSNGVDSGAELDLVTLLCVVSERIRSTPNLLPVFFRRKASRERVVDLFSSRNEDLNPPISPTLSQASTSEASFAFSTSQATGSSPNVADYDCSIFAALVQYLHREGDIGEAARTGLLALIDVACSTTTSLIAPITTFGGISDERRRSTASPASSTPVGERDLILTFAEWILDSDLAEVLSASLGALYGALPGKLVVRAGGASTAGAGADEVAGGAPSGGMVLGGMGALQEDENAEIVARRREEEDNLLRSQGYGISGTIEFTRALDSFLRLFEFAQTVVQRCTSSGAESTTGYSALVEDPARRQQQLVLGAIASTVIATLRTSFLQGVLYPSILECSDTDGLAVAVLSYLEAIFEVLHDGGDFEAAVFAFLAGDDSRIETNPAAARLSTTKLRRGSSTFKHKRQRSRGLVLLDRPGLRTATSSSGQSDYYVSSGRFSLRDLLQANVESSNAATTTAALKLFRTILTKHDRWSLTLLDVELDDLATAFPAVRFAALPELAPLHTCDPPATDDEEDEAEFVYPMRTPRTPRARAAHPVVPPTPLSALRPLLDAGSSSSSSTTVAKGSSIADPLDVLLSLVGEIDPSYRRMRTAGGGSEIVATGFSNYLRDAEVELGRDPGFRRGIASLAGLPESEFSSTSSPPQSPPHRENPLPKRSRPNGYELAVTSIGHRHRLSASSNILSSLLASFSAFFSHSPDVNLALTETLATLALSPYRALNDWCLPTEIHPSSSSSRPATSGGAGLFAPASSLVTAESSAIAQSDSVLAILQALARSISEYRRRIPKFDDYLDERRKGLFFADNLADALEGLDIGSPGLDTGGAHGPTSTAPTPLPVEPSPASKPSSVATGLMSFFSPRRPAHKRSPSSPNAFMTPTRPTAGAHRPSQLRRSASDESLAPPPSPTTRLGGESNGRGPPSRLNALVEDDRQQRSERAQSTGPASPFAAHYRETGSVQVRPILVATPSQQQRFHARSDQASSLTGTIDETDGESTASLADADGPDSPSKRLSPLPPRPIDVDSELQSSAASDISGARPKAGNGDVATVSLSAILDNVIVLEEFVKELAAIVYVRRALGIDPVRLVDTT